MIVKFPCMQSLNCLGALMLVILWFRYWCSDWTTYSGHTCCQWCCKSGCISATQLPTTCGRGSKGRNFRHEWPWHWPYASLYMQYVDVLILPFWRGWTVGCFEGLDLLWYDTTPLCKWFMMLQRIVVPSSTSFIFGLFDPAGLFCFM
jgi:hypothetical protein